MGTSGKPGELSGVHSVAIAQDGSLYFGDIGGRRAQKFTPTGSN